MQLFDIFEATQPRKLVVTYPGRFQPFHQGHAEVFQQLQSKFGSDNVYIVSADKIEQPKSPFSFSDKVQFMRAAGIPAHSIINAAKVYDLPDQFPKDSTVFITVVGEPDAKRLGAGGLKKDGSPSYFQPWPGDFKEAETADRHGYVIVEPEHPKSIEIAGQKIDVSHGTPVRALWNQIKNKPELRRDFITQMYGKYHADLEPILDKIAEGIGLNEEAAGVGVVKNGNDSRYMTATMGDDNHVTADTLPQMMKNYNLIPGKKKTIKERAKRDRFRFHETDRDPSDNIDPVVQQYLDQGGKIEILPYKKPRSRDRMNWGSKHIGTGRGGKAQNMSGTAANTGAGSKPVVAVEQWDTPTAVESAIIRRIMNQHREVLARHGPEAVMRAARDVADWVGDVDEIGSSDVSGWTREVIRSLEDQMTEGMYEYNRDNPFDSEFAPDVGMGRMSLRGWKQTLARRLKDLSDYAQAATAEGNIDKAAMWEQIHKKMQNLNLDPIAREIELAHAELEKIRRQGGTRSRAFRQKEFEVTTLEENWKKKLGALGLAGAISMGAAGPAQADWIDNVFEPVQKVNKVMRDVENLKRQGGEYVHQKKDKIGRGIEEIPLPGAEKFGRELRGDIPPPLVDTSPEADDNARRNAEMNREEERLRQLRRAEQQRQMQQVPDRPWHSRY